MEQTQEMEDLGKRATAILNKILAKEFAPPKARYLCLKNRFFVWTTNETSNGFQVVTYIRTKKAYKISKELFKKKRSQARKQAFRWFNAYLKKLKEKGYYKDWTDEQLKSVRNW